MPWKCPGSAREVPWNCPGSSWVIGNFVERPEKFLRSLCEVDLGWLCVLQVSTCNLIKEKIAYSAAGKLTEEDTKTYNKILQELPPVSWEHV